MRLISIIVLTFFASVSNAAQWVNVSTANIGSVQIAGLGNSHGQTVGLYVGLTSAMTGPAATYCDENAYFVITDPKLMDQAYSGVMFALSTDRTIRFYLDGAGGCVENAPTSSMMILLP
mgnify:CR=1 FL=1